MGLEVERGRAERTAWQALGAEVEAPGTVSSFLQRMGRTGRRPGMTRNCLFLATSDEGLLRAAGLIELWRSGFVEPAIPSPSPLHILA